MKAFLFALVCALFIACGSTTKLNPSDTVKSNPTETSTEVSEPNPGENEMTIDEELMIRAKILAKRFMITDGHVDLPYRLRVKNFRLEKEYIGIPIETNEGDFDYVRAKKGGLDVPFMSIYIPAKYQEEGGAKELADTLINMIEGIIEAHPNNFATCHSVAEAINNTKKGLVSLPMGMENGAPIEDDLSNVAYFYKRGIRYVTLTHSKDNLICDSSYDTTGTWGGLSAFGKQVVNEMNKVGIMVDISHVSDNTFNQVMDMTDVPVIASHSSCRKFTPGFERNMSDDMLLRLKKNNGVIQINFGSSFLDKKVREDFDTKRAFILNDLQERGIEISSEEGQKIIEQYRKDNPVLFSDVEMVFKHIDHVKNLIGIDHVGFGSDFDGVGDSLPVGLKDVAAFPNLIYQMLKNGYTESEIEKVCSGNVLRVWRAVEAYAANN